MFSGEIGEGMMGTRGSYGNSRGRKRGKGTGKWGVKR